MQLHKIKILARRLASVKAHGYYMQHDFFSVTSIHGMKCTKHLQKNVFCLFFVHLSFCTMNPLAQLSVVLTN